MKNLILMLFAITGLGGCATPKYGNLTSNAPYDLNTTLVTDTVKQLESLYPPASNQFNIGQAIDKKDTFGNSLMATLRNRGYAVQEYREKQPNAEEGLNFRYILDAPLKQELYRIKLVVGTDTLTRAYFQQGNTVVPAGAWSRREDQ